MTQLSDIRAFLVAARTGSFAAAGRACGDPPAAVAKRVDRLEQALGVRLFARTTRRLTLTSEGERMRPRLQSLVAEFEQAVREAQPETSSLRGRLRIKSPTTVGDVVGAALARFAALNPGVTVELLLVDRAVNPLEESFDVALGALPMSFASVLDVPLCPYDRVLVASPAYLARNRPPRHPSELAEHDGLAFLPIGLTWSFESAQGPITAEIRARFAGNDSRVLFSAALEGLGVAVLPRFLAREALEDGRLAHVLAGFPLSPIWFKAMVPRTKVHQPEVAALVDHLKAEFAPVPPWDRPAPLSAPLTR
jgi:DNA-binding transcriptional LysR family regulator